MNNIIDKVVIITGASSGIGEATARKLATEGAFIVLVARRKDRLVKLTQEIIDNGGKASWYETDVTNCEQLQEMAKDVYTKQGRIDVIINNAGVMALGDLSLLNINEWDRMIDINIKGVLYSIAAVLPFFEKQNTGHFINIASDAGHKVESGSAVYSGTKHAVRAISEGLRMENAGRFRSTIISPGYIHSELKYGTQDIATQKTVIDAYSQYEISAESVANAIAYAISQPADTAINEILIRPTAQVF